LINEYNALK
jgi:hypothetical protein